MGVGIWCHILSCHCGYRTMTIWSIGIGPRCPRSATVSPPFSSKNLVFTPNTTTTLVVKMAHRNGEHLDAPGRWVDLYRVDVVLFTIAQYALHRKRAWHDVFLS